MLAIGVAIELLGLARKFDEGRALRTMLHADIHIEPIFGQRERKAAAHITTGWPMAKRDARDIERQIEADDHRAAPIANAVKYIVGEFVAGQQFQAVFGSVCLEGP